MKSIWKNPQKFDVVAIAEGPPKDMKEAFLKSLIIEIVEILRIPWDHRQLFEALLLNCLLRSGAGELLEEYENSCIETLAKTICEKFDLGDIQPNYSCATHAKLDPLLERIIFVYAIEEQTIKKNSSTSKE